jgi:hypothetical protein
MYPSYAYLLDVSTIGFPRLTDSMCRPWVFQPYEKRLFEKSKISAVHIIKNDLGAALSLCGGLSSTHLKSAQGSVSVGTGQTQRLLALFALPRQR